MLKAAIVVPTCRPEGIITFLDKWKEQFHGHKIIVTEDSDSRKINFGKRKVDCYSAAEWRKEWGKDAWILSRGNAGHRCFGFWKAWQLYCDGQCDMVVTLDDDCYPDQERFLQKHYEALNKTYTLEWCSSIPEAMYFVPRGTPYGIQNKSATYVNHGVWSNVPDLDAPTQLLNPYLRLGRQFQRSLMPRGTYFAFSGMNVAFRPEAAPLLYFPLMGRDQPYDRFDDIWAGVLMKKCCDHLRWAVTSGSPSVHHSRQSNVFANLIKEAPGIQANETLWEYVDEARLSGNNPVEIYGQLANHVSKHQEPYFKKLGKAMMVWLSKFKG